MRVKANYFTRNENRLWLNSFDEQKLNRKKAYSLGKPALILAIDAAPLQQPYRKPTETRKLAGKTDGQRLALISVLRSAPRSPNICTESLQKLSVGRWRNGGEMVASAERKKERDRLVRKARKLLKELSAFAKNNKSTKTNLTKKIPFAGAKHSPVFVRYLDAKHAGVVRSYRTRFREIDRELAEVGYAGKTKPKRLTPGILLFPIKLTVTKYGKTHASYKYTVTFMSNDVPKTLNRPLPPVFYVVQPRKGFSIAYRDANRATLT